MTKHKCKFYPTNEKERCTLSGERWVDLTGRGWNEYILEKTVLKRKWVCICSEVRWVEEKE
jgi:hypothetical protein